MTADSYPSQARASGSLTDFEYEQLVSSFYPTGIIGVPTDPYPVYTDGTGTRAVKFRAGSLGMVEGCRFINGTSDIVATAASNVSGQDRFDLACWQLDRSASNAVRPLLVTGIPGQPTCPDPVQSSSGAGVWQYPVASIHVPNGATTLVAAQTAEIGYWLAPPSYITSIHSARPKPRKGQSIFEYETNSRFSGNGVSFDGTIADTGETACTVLNTWTQQANTIRRINNVAFLTLEVKRKSPRLAPSTVAQIGAVPVGFFPKHKTQLGFYHNGAYLVLGYVDTAGKIWTQAFFSAAIEIDDVITLIDTSWPTA